MTATNRASATISRTLPSNVVPLSSSPGAPRTLPRSPQTLLDRATTERQRQAEHAFRFDGIDIASLLPKKQPRFAHIGVVDGMGPLAGVKFCEMLINEGFSRLDKEEQTDQCAPTFTLESKSSEIPDRTAFLMEAAERFPGNPARALMERSEDNPLWGMLSAINRVRDCGAKVYAVTCNTAHAWARYFPKGSDFQFVHIVDAALKDALSRDKISMKILRGEKVRIGLMATTGTVQNRIYQDRLQELAEKGADPRYRNLEFVTPDEENQQKVTTGIYNGVKANDLDKGRHFLRQAAQNLIKQEKVDALSLSCTEIPIVIKPGDFPQVEVIDANAALAKEVINVSMEMKKNELETAASDALFKAWQAQSKAKM